MFPAALPAIFTGLRISAGLSVIGAIVGDFFFGQGDTGIGQELRKYANNLDGEELFTAVIMACAARRRRSSSLVNAARTTGDRPVA